MMRIFSIMIFSLLFSSILIVSSFDNSFAEVTAKGTGFEDSTILELKNGRGNTASIETVRIWLSGENEFKTFKTEQGWTGKNTPQGVIIFTGQNLINPGESVKFGIKTTEKNPTVNWKALDSQENVISTSSTTITYSETPQNNPEINEPKIIAIKDESVFRLIPETPNSNSDFRVIGENFVPNQKLDFYIGDKLDKTVSADKDGKILFTSKTPNMKGEGRTEFVLRDSGGQEKIISIRISELENREISDVIKLSLGNTPQQAKRGDTILLDGMATPNTTLTITNKLPSGDIFSIDTIVVAFDGKWKYDNLISPELDLGLISIEIHDGKTTALRNIEVISSKIINLSTGETKYEPGEAVVIQGYAIPNQDMSIILEDSIGTEIFSRSVSVGESGIVNFEIEIPRGSVEGTYILLSYQGDDEGVTIFGVGQEPEPILVVRPTKLNYSSGEIAEISIQGPTNSQVSIILIDSADREKFSDTINLGPDGKEIYKIDTMDLTTGAFTISAKRGESTGEAVFTIGLTTGSGSISLQTTRDEYKPGEQILVLGNTGSINVLLDIIILDSDGKTIKKIQTFSDRFGVFKIDNFRIPSDGKDGEWKIKAQSGGNFKETVFSVKGENDELTVILDKVNYNINDLVEIGGSGARMSATITIKILDSEGNEVDELNVTAKANGEFLTIWQIPRDLEQYHPLGNFEINVDDGMKNISKKFEINQ